MRCMDNIIFYSVLTIEEIEEKFKETDLFSGIIAGLEDALFTSPSCNNVD